LEKRLGHEPLKSDTSERVMRGNALHEPPRLLPSLSVILTFHLAVIALLGVEFGQPIHDLAETTIAAEEFPNLRRYYLMLILIDQARIEILRRCLRHTIVFMLILRPNYAICGLARKFRSISLYPGLHTSFDAKAPCKEVAHVGLGGTNESGREFDEGQAALPHDCR